MIQGNWRHPDSSGIKGTIRFNPESPGRDAAGVVGPGKLHHPGLVPEGLSGIRGKKSDMTARSGRFQKQAVIAAGRSIGKAGGGQERVVQSIDEQCWYSDMI